MTKRDKVLMEHPELDGDALTESNCPSDFGLEDAGISFDYSESPSGCMLTCEECWDKEVDS